MTPNYRTSLIIKQTDGQESIANIWTCNQHTRNMINR